jgi:multidrug transporter EmrE-like cation transporter
MSGYFFLIVTVLCFSLLGVLHKIADFRRCGPSAINAYLVLWYASGLVFALILYWRGDISFTWRELTIGGLMGAASVGGQFSLLTALEKGVPGHVAFPIANGGGLFLVALVGVLFFGERVHAYGIAGIVLGIGATTLLSFP